MLHNHFPRYKLSFWKPFQSFYKLWRASFFFDFSDALCFQIKAFIMVDNLQFPGDHTDVTATLIIVMSLDTNLENSLFLTLTQMLHWCALDIKL